MAESLVEESHMAKAVSNIVPRSERQPDLDQLRETYVETGVLPQVQNFSNQILYGRRGTGKTHVLQMLGNAMQGPNIKMVYIDVRLLGSAHLFQDETQPPAHRCVAVFKDLLALIQGELLEVATDPARDGAGIQEVSEFADFVLRKASTVSSLEVSETRGAQEAKGSRFDSSLSNGSLSLDYSAEKSSGSSMSSEVSYVEALRDTVVFSEVHGMLDRALNSLGVEHLVLTIDEWTSLPMDMQPFVAEFLKRSFFPSNRVTVKIGSLEYRSRFTVGVSSGNAIGFELGPDITANLDLDDYYVYERNPNKVAEIFQEVLFRHVRAGLPEELVMRHNIKDAVSFRARLFTEKATFVELVRSGEGVVRDFLGIFASAFFKAMNSGRTKIDLHSVEEAARDWYETDKSTVLSGEQREALHKIITDVIGARQTKMFMLRRQDADHPMIQSLFDLRLIHLISRGYSDKENPGQRYNIYALDYGTYVDLKRTKAQPDELRDDRGETSSAEVRVVPFADKRSIRRVILDTSIFDSVNV